MKGFIHALLLDGQGGAKNISWEEVQAWSPDKGRLWLHLDYSDSKIKEWIHKDKSLEHVVKEALFTEDTRPRCTGIGDGLLIALRGVNFNPGAEPDDMVSIRLWVDDQRIISTRKRDLLSVADLLEQFQNGKGAVDTADFIVNLTDRLVWRMSDTVDMFEEQMAELEEITLSDERPSGSDIATLRRQTITIRRYLSPQREALSRLMAEKVSWFNEKNMIHMREVSDRLTRHIEDINAVHERSIVITEELLNRSSELLSKRMYVLSLIAAFFLPLSFFTGLLGINVAGIPGAENSFAFVIVIFLLIIVIIFQIIIFKWKKWL
jgi:zinc transporter